MTEVRFYHLTTKTAEQALPEILGKALETGRRAVVRAADDKAAERLSDLLWTFRPDSFLPHGTKRDGFAADQPVYLTAGDENPNGADMLVLADIGAAAGGAPPAGFALCCDLFDGNDPAAVAAARARWKLCREAGCSLTYWRQNERGGWDKKEAA